MPRARHLFRSSVIVIALFAVGKLVGLIRAPLVARAFGAGAEYDAFTAANQLPELLFTVIAGGSLAAAFIPVYSQYLTQNGRESAARLANTVLTVVLVILGSVSAVGIFLAPWLTRHVLVPDFPPEQQLLTAQIMRVILIQTTIFGFSGVLSSVLNAHQHFALPALAPLALDLGYFTGLLLFVPGMGILGLAWGTVVGALLHVAIQVPALIRHRISYRPSLQLRLPGVGEIARLMGPRIVTLGVIQFADLFIIRLASALPTGTTSSYFYGYQLMQFPQTLFGTAIALVMFPTLAELYNAGETEGLRQTAARALGIIWTLTLPAAAAVILLGEPIIVVLLQGGAFDARATALVYAVLVAFSVRIVSESTLEIVARLFYARHNTLTPMVAYLGWLAVTVAGSYLLVARLGAVGLALATTVGFTLLAGALFELNRRRLGGLGGRELQLSFLRALAATAVMTAAIWLVGRVVSSPLLYLLAGAGVGGPVYVAVSWLLGGREVREFWRLIRGRTASGPPSV